MFEQKLAAPVEKLRCAPRERELWEDDGHKTWQRRN